MRRIKNLFHLIESALFATLYGYPGKKLKVIGVTGTDGKTTTCFYIFNILTAAGKKTGLITTIEAKIGHSTYDTGFHVTTPSSKEINRLLNKMVKQGCEFVVLETTSHGLDQFRTFGIPFQIGVVTNVTREHLDYHKTLENYLDAKSKLIKFSKIAVLNKDDKMSFEYMSKKATGKTVSYGLNGADVTLNDLKDINLKMPGDYNKMNALAAVAAAKTLAIDYAYIKQGIESLMFLSGRMEVIQEKPFKIILDFAHTPNALEKALKSIRQELQLQGRVISVFGCAGLRDRGKRSIMGRVADENAEVVILTAEDPRTEKVEDIIKQISEGIKNKELGTSLFKINDRQEAIDLAVKKIAKPGDVVVITGKGHEKSMCFGKTEIPWSDREAILRAKHANKHS